MIGAFAGAGGNPAPGSHGPAGARSEPSPFSRLLVPTDFSDQSKKALRCAARFVAAFASRVTLIHVIEPVMSPDFTHFPLAMDEDKVLEAAHQRLATLGRAHLDARCLDPAIVRSGNPFHEITEAARELKADLIVIATHGYTGIKRALMGSTAERVVRHAQCPVLTVR